MTGAPDWTYYLTAALGVLGFFLSVLNYVNARAAIKRDIRVEGAQLHQAVGTLKELLDKVHQSWSTMTTTAGNLQAVTEQQAADVAEAARLEREVEDIDTHLNWVRFGKLSDRLTLVRQLANEVSQLREKCHRAIADYNRQLDLLRADQRAETAAKLSRGVNRDPIGGNR